jgi:hypothetical protein
MGKRFNGKNILQNFTNENIIKLIYQLNHSIMRVFYTLIFASCTLMATSQKTFLEEHFDYDLGSQLREYGWTPHSAGGTNPILVSSEGLEMPNTNYAGNGIGNAAWVINNGSDENKPFNEWVYPPEGDEPPKHTYASFLIKPLGDIPEATGTTRPYFFHFGEYNDIENPEFSDLSTAFRARTFIYPGTSLNTFRLNLSFNQNEPDPINETGNYDASQVHLIVLKYTSIAGDENDEVSLYVFKDGDDISSEPTTPTIGPLKGTNRDVVLQAVALRQYQDDQNVIVDGIIVRDYWDLEGPSTSTSEIHQWGQVKVFPNPAGSQVNIETASSNIMDARVLDVNGRVSLHETLNQATLDVSSLTSGLYILQILQDGQMFYQKLMIR